MGKRPALSATQRTKISAYHNVGVSERDIARLMNCSETAVHQAIVKFQTSGCFENEYKGSKYKKMKEMTG